MSEMEATVSRGRRVLTGVAVLAIAASGAAWAGCGDDSDEAIDDAQDQANEALEDANENTPESVNDAINDAREGDSEAAA
ncbi:MAG: hypothetical protein ACR2OC_04420, partial [Solirubrobacterales bacterium]